MDDHKFEKDLAIIQLKTTVAALIGSVLLSIGSAVIIFSYSITTNASNPDSLGYANYLAGSLMIAIGLGILIGSLTKKSSEIRKL